MQVSLFTFSEMSAALVKYVACVFSVAAAVPFPSGGDARNLADVPCGQQQRRGSRIVGGHDAVRGEFPWMVSIKKSGGHFCGGTIVNRKWVVTAGHCMCSGSGNLSPDDVTVTVGEHDLTAKEENQPDDVKVSKIHLHPGYECPRFVHDIALIELADEISWSENVRPACFPGADVGSYADREATAAGWGWLQEAHGKGRSDVLQKVRVTVIGNEKCRDWYASQGKKTRILDTQMCAGEEKGGRDACWADSGGPLMVVEAERIAVVGVVSTGIGCGRPKLPGLYTRMTEYMPWMMKMIGR